MKESLKNGLNRMKNWIRQHPVLTLVCVVYFFVFILFCAISFGELFSRLKYESREIGNCDSFLYFTVGRGLGEGLQPYSEMYENKPPFIFILAALSFKLFHNYHLVNILSVVSFVIILLIPIVMTVQVCFKKKALPVISVISILFVSTASMLFMFYCQQNCAEVKVESFGASATLVSMFCLSLVDSNKKNKWYSPKIILSGFFLGIGVMCKEPFSLIALCCILLYCHSKRDLFEKLVLNVLYAGLTAILILLISNSFVPYFTIYLKNMLTSHISIYGSPFERGKHVFILLNALYDFAKPLPLVVFFGLIFTTASELKMHYSDNLAKNVVAKSICAFKPIVSLFVASFAVGLGGQYFLHHFIFAIPLYLIMMVISVNFLLDLKPAFKTVSANADNESTIKQNVKLKPNFALDKDNPESIRERKLKKAESEKTAKRFFVSFYAYIILSVMILFNLTAFSKTPDNEYIHSVMINEFEMIQRHSDYVDKLLDSIDEEHYQWIGFNGPYTYPYTEHRPLGPCFVQDPANFTDENNFFVKSFTNQLDEANVLILQSNNLNLGVLNDYTYKYIFDNFTLEIPEKALAVYQEKPADYNYFVFFRKGKFE